MPPEVFLEFYRIGTATGEPPMEIRRNGPAVTYKGSDLKSGAPVAVTLVPIASVDPAERENFEEKARTALLLDHLNIAKTLAFGETEDSFVFISEYPQGETLEEWVKANGPMPADTVLRVALQVIAALGAASFHGLTHPAIQPANLLIVSGRTAEGGWPCIKLTHFGLSGLKSAPGHPEPDLSASEYASPEQLLQGKVDFRSEIYSLGATLCFLLTGVFYSAYPRSPQTKRFARPLRTLISRTLEDDPAARPQDPVLFTEELRACLATIERRQELRQRFGIPFSPVVAKPPRMPRFRRRQRPTSLFAAIGGSPAPEPAPTAAVARRGKMRYAWAAVALLLVAGVVAALLLPEDVVTAMFHRKKPVRTIGVPVGVPDASPATVTQNNAPVPPPTVVQHNPPAPSAQQTASPIAPPVAPTAKSLAASTQPSVAPSPETAPTSAPEPAVIAQQPAPPEPTDESAPATVAPASLTNHAAASTAESNQGQTAAPLPVAVAENTKVPDAAPPAEAPDEKTASENADQSSVDADANPAGQQAAAPPEPEEHVAATKPKVSTDSAASKSRNKKSIAQDKNRAHTIRVPRALPVGPEDEPAHRGEIKARVVGITPAGNVILALPSGERAIVAPEDADQYAQPRRARRPHRVIIERRMVYPPPQYQAPYQPFNPPDT